MGIVVDLHLQVDGLNVESVDALMDFIQEFEDKCDTVYNVFYDYEVVG